MATLTDTQHDIVQAITDAAMTLRDELYCLLSGEILAVIAEWEDTDDERNQALRSWQHPGSDYAEEAVSRTAEILHTSGAFSPEGWETLCLELLDHFTNQVEDGEYEDIDWAVYQPQGQESRT